MVGAAGDGDDYSCEMSPGSEPSVVTVAGLRRRSLLPLLNSNFGECINVLAPGHDIPSFAREAGGRPVVSSGSSVAAAVVSGVAAVALSDVIALPKQSIRGLTEDHEESANIRVTASLLRAAIRLPEEQDARSPHRSPVPFCKAAGPGGVLGIMRAFVREMLSKKFASNSLANVRKSVMGLAQSMPSSSSAADKAQHMADLGELGTGQGEDSTRGRKSQAEIIQEAKKLKALKKQQADKK